MTFIGYCMANQFKLFILTSGSMEPALATGSLIVTQPKNRYYPGEVITFVQPGELNKKDPRTMITHRILSIRPEGGSFIYKTKGDANKYEDIKSVSHTFIHGKVILAVPLIGYLLIWPSSIIGIYFMVILPAVIIIFYLILKILKIILE